MALLLALSLGFALSACGGKETVSTYGYGEEGTYYSASEDGEDMLILKAGSYILDMGTGSAGTYEYADGEMTFYEGEEEAGYACLTEGGISLTWGGRTYLFLRYEYYTVTFTDGSSTITTQSVLNGKAAADPGDATKEGYVFLGWYTDSSFTERYGFNTSITSDTTIYARFVEIEGTTEYTVTYDFGNGETVTAETLNGKIYDLPEAEMTGYTFIGWWVSATDNASELTYRYDGETLNEDTTLFAVYAENGASYIGASVKDGTLTWLSAPASQMTVTVTDEGGSEYVYEVQTTSSSFAVPSLSETGKYTAEVACGGVTETLVYVSNGLARASGFTVISGSILMYAPVENAEGYYITIECGNPAHDHAYVDNGTSLYYDFSNCGMTAEGITFTVYAYADGYYHSVSSYNWFLGLDKATVTVEDGVVRWDRVENAMEYEVYVNGTLAATVTATCWSLSGYGSGTYEIAVRPVTAGYWSETGESVTYVKTSLAAPSIVGLESYAVSWTAVEGAAGYVVRIGDVETFVEASVTTLYLTDETYEAGLDDYEISVKAAAPDSADDSPWSEAVCVSGRGFDPAAEYADGTVVWKYSLAAYGYAVTVNDGDEIIVTGTNSSPVTLTKSGDNEIKVYFLDGEGEPYGLATVTVYAYAILLDARGGTILVDGEEVDVIYVAKGDTLSLPTPEYPAGAAEFMGWYTLPDLVVDPDKSAYDGDGVLFDDAVFTGNSMTVLYAFWINERISVRLVDGRGTVLDGDGNAVDSALIPVNGESYTVAVPVYDDKAYVFVGWYTGEDGTGNRYTYEDGSAYRPFSNASVTTLYAFWAEALSFEHTVNGGVELLSASKGPDADRVTEITVPETYALDGTEETVRMLGVSGFTDCESLVTINIPDTVTYLNIVNGGYDSNTGVFAGTDLLNVNVYETGEPSTTKEVVYYSCDGVLYEKTSSGGAKLFYYPHARTDETYVFPETVANSTELEFSGISETEVVRAVNAIGDYAFRGHGELTYMVIPERIETLGSGIFYNCTSLAEADIECCLSAVPDYMYYGCSSLAEFHVPETVTEIGSYSYYGCGAFTSLVVPDTVKAIGQYAFYGCSGIVTAYLPEGLETVSGHMFQSCSSLRSVYIPASVTEIATYAFATCTSLEYADIPDRVTTIGTYAFNNCYSLRRANIPSTVTSLGTYSFQNCYALEEIYYNAPSLSAFSTSNNIFRSAGTEGAGITLTIGSSVKSIPNYAFNPYNSNSSYAPKITSVIFEEGCVCTSIGSYAFRYCSYLTGIVIPSTVTSIGTYAFQGCTSLREVYLPDGVSIGTYAFENCYALFHVTIPVGATVGSYAFHNCYKLAEVEDLAGLGIEAGGGSSNGYAGDNAINVYTATSGESHMVYIDGYAFIYDDEGNYYFISYVGEDTDLVIPEEVNGNAFTLYDYLFYGDSTITSIVIPEGVTSLSYYAFYECTSLTSVTLPGTLGSLDAYCFYGCSSLKEIVLPESVTEVPEYAFYGCTSLESAALSAGTTSVGQYAFYNCSSLAELDLPDGVVSIGAYAYRGCGSLESIAVPAGVTEIADYTFYNCTSVLSVTLPEGLGSIGAYAFYNCNSLSRITVPSTVESVGNCAFQNCYKLVEVVNLSPYLELEKGSEEYGYLAYYALGIFGPGEEETSNIYLVGDYYFYLSDEGNYLLQYDGIPEGDLVLPDGVNGEPYAIYRNAFQGYTGITSVVIPDSVTDIGEYAFYNCTYMTTVTIGGGVRGIGDYAFSMCSRLVSVTMGDGVETIGDYAFNNCTNLADVRLSESLVTIGGNAFSYNGGIVGIVIPDSVEYLGGMAFYNCTLLEWIVIGSGVTYIDSGIFDGSRIGVIYYRGTEEEWNGIYIITDHGSNSKVTSATRYYYSEERPDLYEGGNFWYWDEDGNIAVWE